MTSRDFAIRVPFESVEHESIDSSSASSLPTGRFGSFEIDRDDDGLSVSLVLRADSPSDAMRAGLGLTEDLFRLVAVSNDAFRARAGSVSANPVPDGAPTPLHEHLFFHGHLGTRKLKGSLESEASFLANRAGWPEYLRDALELNYLAVVSERLPTKRLLETIALERLAQGRLGSRPDLFDGRSSAAARSVRKQVAAILSGAGLGERDAARAVQRMMTTEAERAAAHMGRYLAGIGLKVDLDEIGRWWAGRGGLAHGRTDDVDVGELSRLTSTTQAALRHELGAAGPRPATSS